ncbi:hypothetical protein CANARDRAFT_5596 [[Candida] arabinofermentans NRRL YB-2248]|uniref:Uncharacterized protein n=1 Tax=[Candida] arabinofermentans NRRL YB-2248 TaxID=983967 RepID=A0A1E4T9B5_9ASCO|nr:hypothetical protein CANARDRAFT_5596 [[Candida] arabinofermentans NRRL YB-2248]
MSCEQEKTGDVSEVLSLEGGVFVKNLPTFSDLESNSYRIDHPKVFGIGTQEFVSCILIILPIFSYQYLEIFKDRRDWSLAPRDQFQDATGDLKMFGDKPPFYFFLNFLISFFGLDTILGKDGDSQPLQVTIAYVIVVNMQICMLLSQCLKLATDLNLQYGDHFELAYRVLSVTVLTFVVGYSFFRFPRIRLNGESFGAFLKRGLDFQLRFCHSLLVAFGCLFELCSYSTTGFVEMMQYYDAQGNNLVTGLVVIHVFGTIMVGCIVLTHFVCCLTSDKEEQPWISYHSSTSFKVMCVPFVFLSAASTIQMNITEMVWCVTIPRDAAI